MKAAFPASSFTAAAARVQMGCAGSWAAPRAPRPRPFGGHDPGGAAEKDDEGPRLGGGTRATAGWEGPREAAESGVGDSPTRRCGWHPGTAHRDRQGRAHLGEALRFELKPIGPGWGPPCRQSVCSRDRCVATQGQLLAPAMCVRRACHSSAVPAAGGQGHVSPLTRVGPSWSA